MARRFLPCALSCLLGLAGAWLSPARAGESNLGMPLVALAPGGPLAPEKSASPLVALATSPFAAAWRSQPTAVDRTKGRPVEIGGDRVRRFIYCDTFREPWCLEDAAVEGLNGLRWDPQAPALLLEGHGPGRQRLRLTYRFTAPYDAKELVASLEGEIAGSPRDRVSLALSLDGRDFILPARACGRPAGNPFHLTTTSSYYFDGLGFWIRVEADLQPGSRVVLRRFVANCRVKPPGRPEVTLTPDVEGRLLYTDAFASSRILHLAEVENPSALEWQRGALLLRGREGAPTQVVIRQRFLAPDPLRSLLVRVHHAVNRRELGGTSSFALSLDGRTPLASCTTPGDEGVFRGVTELRLDSPAALREARQFYLHITLSNDKGSAAAPSNVLSAIEVEARPAEREARAAMAP
ncbi:MAG TPA: hypothetical protein PLE19_21825 [Planctomycetota bacterium]|nr:hypothetical protein [Planctomycetota bacterium]HRR82474.1 hypothetical protein [Planctomycetota bacterium]